MEARERVCGHTHTHTFTACKPLTASCRDLAAGLPAVVTVCVCMPVCSVASVMCSSFATPWTVAHQVPLSRGLSQPEYWSGLHCPFPGSSHREAGSNSWQKSGGWEPATSSLTLYLLTGNHPLSPGLCEGRQPPAFSEMQNWLCFEGSLLSTALVVRILPLCGICFPP